MSSYREIEVAPDVGVREFRDQTCRLVTAVLAAMGTFVGAMGVFLVLL